MSIARTVSSIVFGALSPLGNHTNNTPVVNNNITISHSESTKGINSNTDSKNPCI